MSDTETKIDGIRPAGGWGLLGCWICVKDGTPMENVVRGARTRGMLDDTIPDSLIPDRLFGGFPCADDEDCRHVYFSSGHYTFLDPELNGPMRASDRADVWKELFDENGRDGWKRTGPGVEDAPEAT